MRMKRQLRQQLRHCLSQNDDVLIVILHLPLQLHCTLQVYASIGDARTAETRMLFSLSRGLEVHLVIITREICLLPLRQTKPLH